MDLAQLENLEEAIGGYNVIDWHVDEKLLFCDDLESHNTLPCRATISN